jgi:geranylgeranyl pyrophosphate synthase
MMTKPSSELAAKAAPLATFLAECARTVDHELDRLIPAEDVSPRRVHQAIRWSLFGGGKRLRPALVIAAGETFGAPRGELLSTACALELIHTYSLIHDDLPAMDDDDLRRGRATCHIQFDEATAILAGDALQSLAFQTIAADESLSPELRLQLVSSLAHSAGTPDGMVAGQALDLEADASTVDAARLITIHQKKTGALICASVLSGAMIARAPVVDRDNLAVYAHHLGLLFQITDDLLDVTASAVELGKTPGKDERAQKATYVSLYGLEKARNMAAAEYSSATAALDQVSRNTDLLRSIAQHFHHRRA